MAVVDLRSSESSRLPLCGRAGIEIATGLLLPRRVPRATRRPARFVRRVLSSAKKKPVRPRFGFVICSASRVGEIFHGCAPSCRQARSFMTPVPTAAPNGRARRNNAGPSTAPRRASRSLRWSPTARSATHASPSWDRKAPSAVVFPWLSFPRRTTNSSAGPIAHDAGSHGSTR